MSVAGKPFVILAPHVDDEVIGCFQMLDARLVSHVVYFYEVDDVRKAEALACAERFGFEAVFDWDNFHTNELLSNQTLLVPNIADHHPDHKAVNRLAKQLPNKKLYYSIDMNVQKTVLDNRARNEKMRALCNLFPSQSGIFSDQKFYLFESYVEDDSSKMIWVKFQKEGIHCYPQALTEPELADVSFLGHPHRHIFHFKVWIEVFHDDRDIEFIQFKRWLKSLYDGSLQLDFKSCEMLADELALKIQSKYPGRRLKIEVSEDDENGVEVEYQ